MLFRSKEAIKKVLGIDVRVKIIDENEINLIDSFLREDSKSKGIEDTEVNNEDPDLERVKTFAEQNGIPLNIKT